MVVGQRPGVSLDLGKGKAMYEKKYTVIVWGEPQEVTARKVSKSRWVASGTYTGEFKQTKDATEGSAVKRWREWADYKGMTASTGTWLTALIIFSG